MSQCLPLPHAQHTTLLAHFLPAFAFGPQFARGFSGNRANFRSRDGGLAFFLISKLAFTLYLDRQAERERVRERERETARDMASVEGATMMNANKDLGSFARMAAPGDF